MRRNFWIAIVIFKCMLLTACDLGEDNIPGIGGDADVVATYQGSVGDGPVVGATIIISDKNGVVLDSIVSDAFANYKVSIQAKETSYPLTIKAIGGIDLVTDAAPTFELISTVLYPLDTIANINPFSTFIVRTAEAMGGLTEENIEQATATVLRELNFGFDGALMLDPIATEVTESEVASLVKVSESLGELVRRTKISAAENGIPVSENDVIAMISADLVDGVLDGKGESGVNEEIALRAKVIAGGIILESLPNRLRVNNVVATAALDASIVTIMPDASPMPNTGEVVSTAEMIIQLETAIKIGQRIAPSTALSELMGLTNSLVGILPDDTAVDLLPEGAQASLNDGLNVIAMLSAEEITELNLPITGEVNNPPVITGTAPVSVAEGVAYLFEPESSDVDGDLLVYTIAQKPLWAEFDVATGALSGTPGFDQAGLFSAIIISVTDGEEIVALEPFSITVENVNRPPLMSGEPLTGVVAGMAYDFTPVASDEDGDTLVFSIVNPPIWSEFNVDTGQLSGLPDNSHVGLYQEIVIQVTDGTEVVFLPEFSITVGLNNSAPTISGVPGDTVAEASAYSFLPGASDPDGDALTFSIINRPAWAAFDSNSGQLSGVPGYLDSDDYPNIQISVSDGYVVASLAQFSITVTNVNRVPTISGTPLTTVNEQSAYSFTPTANDLDNDPLTFSVLNLPAWAALNTATGELSGTPGISSSPVYSNIILQVSDGSELVALAPFNISVNNGNRAPTISGTPITIIDEGILYRFTPNAADADGDELTFSVLNKPEWAGLNAMTGELSGTPGFSSSQVYSDVTLQVSDGNELVALAPFNITVNNVNRAPTISGTPSITVDEQSAYSFIPTANDLDNDSLTFSVLNLPAWAGVNVDTGELTGIPDYSSSMVYSNVTLQVNDGTDTVSLAPFDITVVNVNRAPTISGTPIAVVEEGAAYSFVPVANDADGDVLLFSIVNQPVWANFNSSTGELSGIPAGVDIGSYADIVVSVSDDEQLVSLDSFNLIVSEYQAPVTGSATLSWVAPMTRIDGSQIMLSELKGYRLYYGTSADNMSLLIDLSDSTVTQYVVEGLEEGTHYFSVSVYDTEESESERSEVVSKTI
ncbi:MAG: putative Ig domain-containing protein [Gammaproteobacteria bacterium]|nr:putative Ig domain-containing protein [Gammaproteobacteria bacterium]